MVTRAKLQLLHCDDDKKHDNVGRMKMVALSSDLSPPICFPGFYLSSLGIGTEKKMVFANQVDINKGSFDKGHYALYFSPMRIFIKNVSKVIH